MRLQTDFFPRSSFFFFRSSFFLLCSSLACTPAPPEQQFLDDALRAVGGRARIEAVKTIAIEGSGVNYNLGQDMKPEAATQQFAVSGYTRQIDVAQGRQRVEQTRTPKFAYFQGPKPQTHCSAIPHVRNRCSARRLCLPIRSSNGWRAG